MCGKTIAVLGGGFNKIFPTENEWLYQKIITNGGCIVSEYAPNIEADRKNFPKRNRIVSGLADIVLVVEAEYRSGTAITAAYARKQGKTVCCLPSNIDSRCAHGTNRLIQEGARLVVKPREIEELLVNNTKLEIDRRNEKEIPKEYQEIYDLLVGKILHINEICNISKKDISNVTEVLTMLELEEIVEQLPGNMFKIKEI